MQPFQQIFPDTTAQMLTLSLDRKVGRIPKGDYIFLEAYCTDKGCDCRRVTLIVLNKKGQDVATIDFGFDPAEPMAGPFLNDFGNRAAYAEELLDAFVDGINGNPEWLENMYGRYRQVRQKVEGKPYRGKPFPKPGSVVRTATGQPDMEATLLEMAASLPAKGKGQLLKELFEDAPAGFSEPLEPLSKIIDRYTKDMKRGFDAMNEVDYLIRTQLFAAPDRFEELAVLLPLLIPRNVREEERLDAAFALLRGTLEILREEMAAGRQMAKERMEALQEALARHVFGGKGDVDLAARVTRLLLDTRVEILPVIRNAYRQRMFSLSGETGPDVPTLTGPPLGTLLRKAGCQSPFEGAGFLLDLTILLDPAIQVALYRDLLDSRDSFVRDTGALMLFHPQEKVREEIAAILATGAVRAPSPETLRRLIISRNWFPAGMRKQVDEAITAARRAKVVCAQLSPPPDCRVRASTIDGAGAQSFFITAGTKKRKVLCNILWKQGAGVIDTFVVYPDQKEAAALLDDLPENMAIQEVAPGYLDRMVCHALAVGSERGEPPHLGLLQVAEVLGCDRWKADRFDPEKEIAAMRTEMEGNAPHLLGKAEQRDAMDESELWPDLEPFADTWYEDDVAVDEAIRKTHKGKKCLDHERLDRGVLDEVLEPRRAVWLERLALMTLWLRDSATPPVPWHQMFHLAETLATGKRLKDIPLMVSVAAVSVTVALERGVLEG